MPNHDLQLMRCPDCHAAYICDAQESDRSHCPGCDRKLEPVNPSDLRRAAATRA